MPSSSDSTTSILLLSAQFGLIDSILQPGPLFSTLGDPIYSTPYFWDNAYARDSGDVLIQNLFPRLRRMIAEKAKKSL
jgi:hypothetical protein